MIRDEVVARCDVCDAVVTGGNPEQRQEVAKEFMMETATAMVGGYSVQICDDCLNSGRFQDTYGNHPVLGKHRVEAPALTTGARGQFPRHPRRNTRLRDNVIDGVVESPKDDVLTGTCYKCRQMHPSYVPCDPEDVVDSFQGR